MTDKTAYLGLELPNFLAAPWHDQVNNNFTKIDATLKFLTGLSNLKGPWQNSTAVVVGDRYFQEDTSQMYLCLVSHTTAASPTTFAQDRIANPTYWAEVDSVDLTGWVTIAGAVFPDGSLASPALRFDTSTNSGLVWAVIDGQPGIGIVIDGAVQAHIRETGIVLSQQVTGAAVMSNNRDTTVGKLMKVGAYGLGATGERITAIDDASLPTGLYNFINTASGTFPAGATNGFTIIVKSAATSGYQLLVDKDKMKLYHRSFTSGIFSSWKASEDKEQWVDTVAALAADTELTYVAGNPKTVVAGDYVLTRAENYVYKVAASGATNHQLTTAGGVKLYLMVIGSQTFYTRGSIYETPTQPSGDEWLFTEFPVDGLSGHAITAFGVGTLNGRYDAVTGGAATKSRITAFGAANLQKLQDGTRLDAFGSGVMRFTKFGERNSAFGSLSMQWAGGNLADDVTGKYYNHDVLYNMGVPITDPAWNFSGFETANPGIRATIAAWLATSPWINVETGNARNCAFGRDAMVQFIKGTNNCAFGYRASSMLLDGNYNAAFGADALASSFFGIGNTAQGYVALTSLQEGDNNTAIGRAALNSIVKGANRLTALGYSAGRDVLGGDNSIYVGPFAGSQDPGTGHTSRLYVQGGATGYLVGEMNAGKLGIGVGMTYADLANTKGLLLRSGAGLGGVVPNVSARMLVVEETTGPTGITIKTSNAEQGLLYFADTDDNNPGGVTYDHATDTLSLRAGDVTRFAMGTSTRIVGALHVAPGASVTPANNGDVTMQLTSNTQLTFKAKGSDGVVRSASLTLA